MDVRLEHENAGVITNFYELANDESESTVYTTCTAHHKHEKERKPYAVKTYNKEVFANKLGYLQMRDQVAVLANANHENIVSYKEFMQDSLNYYIVTELLRGGEVLELLVKANWYTEREVARVLKQVFLAVQHLHQLNFVHRDIRPENLVLTSKEHKASVKIADFTYACPCVNDKSLRTVIKTAYVAPEVAALRQPIEGQPGYGRPVDIWALGVCLYIMLSGIHPFEASKIEQTMDCIEIGHWVWMGNNWDTISRSAKSLIEGMLNPDSDTRFTIQQCLEHPWINGAPDADDLRDVAKQVQQFLNAQKYQESLMD